MARHSPCKLGTGRDFNRIRQQSNYLAKGPYLVVAITGRRSIDRSHATAPAFGYRLFLARTCVVKISQKTIFAWFILAGLKIAGKMRTNTIRAGFDRTPAKRTFR